MLPLIEEHRSDLAEVCQRYDVQRLEVFGSATTSRFIPSSSDLDFIVSFANPASGCADRYLALAEALEAMFSRPVDLLTERSIRNPVFRQAVNESRQLVYEQGSTQAAA